ncbi:molybdopterin-containing oxidoreductase family protein [Aromatoleum diolicum]|nr:molybdopterin-dependent oxidoreductase [Aromatoleum diolicum]
MIETHKSFCRFCHVFCGIQVDVDKAANRVVAVRPDRDNLVSQGYTCPKGRAEMERLYHPNRLLSSRKRVGDEFVDIGKRQALDEVGAKLREIIDQHGPESVAVYIGDAGHRMSASGPWFVRKWLDAIGSRGFYTSYTVDSPSLVVAMQRLWGSLMPFSLFDIDHADVCMFIATNPVVSHMLTMPQSNPSKRLRDARKRGMKLIVIDPRRCEVAKVADIHLQVKPGEDATLLAALIKVILDRRLYAQDYVAQFGSGLAELHDAVGSFDLDYASRRTGVPAQLIEDAAVAFATAGSGAATSGTGLHMARHQNLTTQLVMTLNALCGRYDRRGGMLAMPGTLAPEMPEGSGPIPLPLHPGPVSRVRGIRALTNWLGVEEMPSNTLTDEILTPGKGQIRALIVHGGNPALVFPDEAGTVKALKSLDLLVVNELFMSATAKYADYVLACRHPYERADVPRLMDAFFPFPYSQYTPPLVQAPDSVFQEFEVFWDLARQLGVKLDIPGISMEHQPTADEMLDGLNAGSRIPMAKIREHAEGHIWGDTVSRAGHILPGMIGNANKRFDLAHPEVVAELREVQTEYWAEGGGYAPSDEHAFRMITYREDDVYCTQGQNLPDLRRRIPYNPVMMNPDDMQALGLADGDAVKVSSSYGSVEGLVAGGVEFPRGVIGIAHGWGDPAEPGGPREKGINVQRLIPDDQDFDPITGLAQMSAIAVSVVPLAQGH